MTSRRALGVDLGERRIGIALSDAGGVIASPDRVLVRAGRVSDDHRALVELARSAHAEVIVVGLPLSLDGREGPAARKVLAEVDQLRAAAGPDLRVETYDERLTTVVAEQALRESGVRGHERRQVVDKVAAAVMLQGWLDSRR